MITKEELIKKIKSDINTEESGVALYTKHLKDTLFFSGISKEKRKRIVELLDRLADESRIHEKTMKALLSRIIKSDRDVY